MGIFNLYYYFFLHSNGHLIWCRLPQLIKNEYFDSNLPFPVNIMLAYGSSTIYECSIPSLFLTKINFE